MYEELEETVKAKCRYKVQEFGKHPINQYTMIVAIGFRKLMMNIKISDKTSAS